MLKKVYKPRAYIQDFTVRTKGQATNTPMKVITMDSFGINLGSKIRKTLFATEVDQHVHYYRSFWGKPMF